MEITGYEPAFNEIHKPENKQEEKWQGLTVRQQFSVAAMQGLMSCDRVSKLFNSAEIAKMAVSGADALIAELNKDEYV